MAELAKYRFKKPIETRWSDMDEMRHINNAVYLTFLEQARAYYFHESCQWNWKDDGVILANCHIEYIRPLRFPERAYTYLRVSKMGSKSFALDYVLTRETAGGEECIATASTVLVMFDYKANTSIAVPDRLREKLWQYEKTKF